MHDWSKAWVHGKYFIHLINQIAPSEESFLKVSDAEKHLLQRKMMYVAKDVLASFFTSVSKIRATFVV